jgi:hypothetical protein
VRGIDDPDARADGDEAPVVGDGNLAEAAGLRGVTLRSQKRARSLPFSTVLYIAR